LSGILFPFFKKNLFSKEYAMTVARSVIIVFVVMTILSAGSAMVFAQEATEHPLIRPFPGAELYEKSSGYKKFDAYDFQVKDPQTGKAEKKTVQGEYRRLLYYLYHEDGSRNKTVSRLEYFENFKAAALEKGGEIKWEDSRSLIFTIPREDNGVTWCQVQASVGAGSTTLIIIDEKPLETTLQFGPTQMKAALDAEGKVALYGILIQGHDAQAQVPVLAGEKPDHSAEQRHVGQHKNDDIVAVD
jgi:hypothetical protein